MNPRWVVIALLCSLLPVFFIGSEIKKLIAPDQGIYSSPYFYNRKNRIREVLENQCEQNAIDFKEYISENNARLKEHVNALAHCIGGRALVFGVNAKFQKLARVVKSEDIIARVTSLAHATQESPLKIEAHHISTELGNLARTIEFRFRMFIVAGVDQ